jgi:hypothetical protein
MTRPLIALLAGGLLTFSVAVLAPAPVAQAAVVPRPTPKLPPEGPPPVTLFLGDGVLRLRIRSCPRCDTSVTIEIRFGETGFPR